MKKFNLSIKILILTSALFISCTNSESEDLVEDIYVSIPDNKFEEKLIVLGIDSDGVINQKALKIDVINVERLDLNNTSEVRFKAVITARPIALQNIASKLNEKANPVRYLLSYSSIEHSDFIEYIGNESLIKLDQRNDWWNQYFVLKGKSNHNLPEQLNGENYHEHKNV